MLTISQVQNLDVSGLESVRDEWGKMASRLGAYQDRVESQMRAPLQSAWSGVSAQYAQMRILNLEANLHYGYQECSIVKDALDQILYQLKRCQTNLQASLDQIPRDDFKVEDNGDVVYTGPARMQLDGLAIDGTNREMPEDRYEEWIKGHLKEAAGIDSRYSDTLAKLRTDDGLKIKKHDAARDAKALKNTTPDVSF